MTTTTDPGSRQRAGVAPVPSAAEPTGVPFGRLVRMELRKLVDTRAGTGLVLTTGLVCLAAMVLVAVLTDPAELSYFALVSAGAVPQALLLPILGILSVTGEWTQRSTLTTFVLEPRRARVATAKLVAATTAALLAAASALGAGALIHLVVIATRGAVGDWGLDPGVVGGAVLMQLISVVMGVAFGMAVMQGTLAVVGFLLLPTAWTLVGSMVSGLNRAAEWLDVARTGTPFFAGEAGGLHWLRLTTSVVVWVGIPLAVGYRRWVRREVS